MPHWETTNPVFKIDKITPQIREKSAWLGHRNFVFDLIKFLRPGTVVELGTHYGASFFTFCQALQDGEIKGKCYAIDTWRGDDNTGAYDDEVFELVKNTLDGHFASVGEMIRLTFDEALERFPENSIDVLHIDGAHDFESVAHDFDSWLPKLASGGVVLMHDTAVNNIEGFGVFRLWETLKGTYPHLEFIHWNGLGVLFPKGLTTSTKELIDRKVEIETTYTVRNVVVQEADPKTIAFIICSNNEEQFEVASRHISNLDVPEGYKTQTLRIANATSMTAGYNFAMTRVNAKYKVYLHQDVYIINPQFIFDMLALFQKNEKLGMIGLCGAERLPLNGIWWESSKRVGKVLENRGIYRFLEHAEVESEIQTVDVIDGFLMATQYDLVWREDLFDGWHFYDASQSLEFKKAGYRVGVPKQGNPWCVHYMGMNHPFDKENYLKYQKVFLQNYWQMFWPKDSFPNFAKM